MSKLKGYKTYLASLLAVVYALSALAYGAIDVGTAFQILSTAFIGSGLRDAIGK